MSEVGSRKSEVRSWFIYRLPLPASLFYLLPSSVLYNRSTCAEPACPALAVVEIWSDSYNTPCFKYLFP